MSQTNKRLYATDFHGKKLYEISGSGVAKYLPEQSDKIFVAGTNANVYDLEQQKTLLRVTCHDNVTAFGF